MTPEEQRANDLALQIAQTEILRILVSEVCFDPDPQVFRDRVQKLEDAAVTSITGRKHFPNANEYTENLVKETAAGWVTRLFTSIRHPAKDASGDKP